MPKQKLTPWFPASVKPVHVGVYEITERLLGTGYCYWNGYEWANMGSSINKAYENRDWLEGAYQSKNWRGLAEQPKEKS